MYNTIKKLMKYTQNNLLITLIIILTIIIIFMMISLFLISCFVALVEEVIYLILLEQCCLHRVLEVKAL